MGYVEPYKNASGAWMVPVTVTTPGVDVVGIAWTELDPSNEMYDKWLAYIAARSEGWASEISDQMQR